MDYVRTFLKNQDVSNVAEYSRFYKGTNGTLPFLDNVFIKTIPSTFDDIISFNNKVRVSLQLPFEGNYFLMEESKNLELKVKLMFQPDLTYPELLILNELALSEYRTSINDDYNSVIKTLDNFLFQSFILHILCRELKIDPKKLIQRYMTVLGRIKFNNENEQYEEEEEEAREWARMRVDGLNELDSEREELKSEMKYIRENGGDWIDD